MNATTVQKWIRKNAPEYRLVRTQYIETLQTAAARGDEAGELLASTTKELARQISDLEDQNHALRARAARASSPRRTPGEIAADHGPGAEVVVSGGPDSVIAADKVSEEGGTPA